LGLSGSSGGSSGVDSEEIGDRRVALGTDLDERYSVTIAVRGPHGTWENISVGSQGGSG